MDGSTPLKSTLCFLFFVKEHDAFSSLSNIIDQQSCKFVEDWQALVRQLQYY